MSDTVTQPHPRALVVCLDGTTNQFDVHNTNVVRFFSLLKKDNFDEQLCYYQPGIGTFLQAGVVEPYLELGAKLLDSAFAWYIDGHVQDAYRFLMQNYRQGDKICIFGFSRGAYTARALAGMLHKIGLLPSDNQEQVAFAYKLYARTDPIGVELAKGFKKSFCTDVSINFVGLWDTVASIGLFSNRTLPDTDTNASIKTVRHALALDERRCRFKANSFYAKPPPEQPESWWKKLLAPPFYFSLNPFDLFVPAPNAASELPEEHDNEFETDVREVWFVGAHEGCLYCRTDVGGGADWNLDKTGQLRNIALRWMVNEVLDADTGIIFKPDSLAEIGLDIKLDDSGMRIPNGKSSLGVVEPELSEEDKEDAIRPIHDSLNFAATPIAPFWWILELIPMSFRYQDKYGKWHSKFAPNLGEGRLIVGDQPKFHESVRERMRMLGYKPAAIWDHHEEYVVQ
ncbi:hypothetical protein CYLTODRAFT_429206 [Cylindrobasidium torrendii FP15055 ss-10]|uniref:T6SS Phospholipase effector Tle1-like catalytic domain-containing protein n=1 Tax=Cylindrobasidium torrendii FP15055 ss-10 TaxID=1314674 RepID=A0A0D7BQS4_9AGAR|nr:hypothetical protein CYLTODRAFT_429206 [Cylindrobasidium torrendii FP15055 ss-10]